LRQGDFDRIVELLPEAERLKTPWKGKINDLSGAPHTISGTYDLYVARPMDIDIFPEPGSPLFQANFACAVPYRIYTKKNNPKSEIPLDEKAIDLVYMLYSCYVVTNGPWKHKGLVA